MPSMKTTLAMLIALPMCAIALHLAAAQPKAPPKAPELLFVQTAKNLAYKDGVLTLQDVSPVTAFFSDRPQRIVGQVRNDLFLKQWSEGKNSFRTDPPNADISVFSPGARPTGAVVVLSNPRLEGKNLLYDVRSLKGTLPANGTETTVFIDGSGAPCDPLYQDGDAGYPCWAQKAFSGEN
jgi:hypothetical protein